jgi:lysophospholipase L1-like esterase
MPGTAYTSAVGAPGGGHAYPGYSGTYARAASTAFRAGRLWLFAGDSITNGSTASNFVYSYSRQACHMVGTAYASSDSIEAGTSGYTSAQLLAFMPTLLTTYSPDAVHIQIGTNDVGAAVPLATFQANIRALVALVKAAGKPVTIGTVPPRGTAGTTTAKRQLTAAYNLWLRLWAPGAGVELADTHAALVDTTSGDYLSTYDSGDNTHPNDAGHREMARAVAAAMIRAMPTTRPSLVNAFSTSVSLISNPLMLSGGTNPTGSVGGVATGTAPTNTPQADTSGVLPAGQWAEIDLNAGATSTFGRDFVINASLWAVGDVLAITGLMQVVDVTGGGAWDTAVAAGTATASVNIINAGSGLSVRAFGDRCAGRVLSSGVYNIGPFFTTYTVAGGITGMTLRYQVALPNGLHIKARFGCLNVWNLTTLGVSGGTAAMINVDGT